MLRRRGERKPAFFEFIGDADLAEGRLFDSDGDDGVLNSCGNGFLDGFLATDFLESHLAAGVVEF